MILGDLARILPGGVNVAATFAGTQSRSGISFAIRKARHGILSPRSRHWKSARCHEGPCK
jgi:hypothetical protein